MDAEWTQLKTIDQFREAKRCTDGVVVIRGGARTKFHAPDCPFVTEAGFEEKLTHPKGGYFWVARPELIATRWPGATQCGHPSDPLNGGAGGTEASSPTASVLEAVEHETWEMTGPSRTLREVRAAADWTLPFEPRRDDQVEFRAELRRRVRRLTTLDDEVLHASFFGAKPIGADAENLLLYNVDESGAAFVGGQHGLRFELAPPGFDLARAAGWVYRPVPLEASFSLWEADAVLASWPRLTLESSPAKVAPLWLALCTAPIETGAHSAGPFAVNVRVGAPPG